MAKKNEMRQLDLLQVMKEAQSGSELDEADKNTTDAWKRYFGAKVVALELEKRNNSRLILFESVNKTPEEWYKMGGNSALFYKYIIGPRMSKKPKIRPDKDMKHRFKGGIVAVHWGDKFIESMGKIGYKTYRKDDEMGMLIFELEKQWKVAEIKELRQMEQRESERINMMLRPKNDAPDMYGLILRLVVLVPPKIRKLNLDYREVFGPRLLAGIIDLVQIYMNMANGYKDKIVAKEELLRVIDGLSAVVLIINENHLWDVASCMRIAETVSDLRVCVEKKVRSDRSRQKRLGA